jgi:hypothetical protein
VKRLVKPEFQLAIAKLIINHQAITPQF